MDIKTWKKLISLIGLATQIYGSIEGNPYLVMIGGISSALGILLMFGVKWL